MKIPINTCKTKAKKFPQNLIKSWDVTTAMEQAERSSDSPKKVSSLEEQMSILMAKIVQLEERDIYMTKIIKTTCEQLQCKLPEPSSVFVVTLCSIYLDSCFLGICLDPVAKDR
jgi:hypothetical protein